MELPDIGKNCALETCQQLDFLPFKCDFCSKIFCQVHNLPESHDCQEEKYVLKERIDCGQPTKYICSLTSCKNKELTPVCCEHCLGNFCLKHRHQVDHECPRYSPVKNPMAEAAAKVGAMTKALPSKTKQTKLNPKNEKLAAKIPNVNNVTNAPQLALFQASNKSLVRPLTSPLKQLIEEERIHNGQTLLLEFINEESLLHAV